MHTSDVVVDDVDDVHDDVDDVDSSFQCQLHGFLLPSHQCQPDGFLLRFHSLLHLPKCCLFFIRRSDDVHFAFRCPSPCQNSVPMCTAPVLPASH